MLSKIFFSAITVLTLLLPGLAHSETKLAYAEQSVADFYKPENHFSHGQFYTFDQPVESVGQETVLLDDPLHDFIQTLFVPVPLVVTDKDKNCLARNIYHEAANEPEEGMIAVAVVTLNRATNPKYPNNICDVVYQRGSFSAKKTVKVSKNKTKEVVKTWIVCQFSWTCERVHPPKESDRRWIRIQELVEHLAEGGFNNWREKYRTSFHYHAYYVNPRWRLNRLTRTGAHIFYE